MILVPPMMPFSTLLEVVPWSWYISNTTMRAFGAGTIRVQCMTKVNMVTEQIPSKLFLFSFLFPLSFLLPLNSFLYFTYWLQHLLLLFGGIMPSPLPTHPIYQVSSSSRYYKRGWVSKKLNTYPALTAGKWQRRGSSPGSRLHHIGTVNKETSQRPMKSHNSPN